MAGLDHFLFSQVFDVTEQLVELKLELISLSFEIGREHALQVMRNLCPGMWTEIPPHGETHSLEKSGLGESNGAEVGEGQGSLFHDLGFTLFAGSSKDPSGEETQAYPLPQVNSSTGPSHIPSPNGSLYETKGRGPAGLFCTKCLSVGGFTLSSQFKKLYVYIASMVKFLGVVS